MSAKEAVADIDKTMRQVKAQIAKRMKNHIKQEAVKFLAERYVVNPS